MSKLEELLREHFGFRESYKRPDETALNRVRFDRFAQELRRAREETTVSDYSVQDDEINQPHPVTAI